MMSIYALYELSVRVTAINDRVSFQMQLVQMSVKIFRQPVSLLQRVAQQVQNSALKIMILTWLPLS